MAAECEESGPLPLIWFGPPANSSSYNGVGYYRHSGQHKTKMCSFSTFMLGGLPAPLVSEVSIVFRALIHRPNDMKSPNVFLIYHKNGMDGRTTRNMQPLAREAGAVVNDKQRELQTGSVLLLPSGTRRMDINDKERRRRRREGWTKPEWDLTDTQPEGTALKDVPHPCSSKTSSEEEEDTSRVSTVHVILCDQSEAEYRRTLTVGCFKGSLLDKISAVTLFQAHQQAVGWQGSGVETSL
ncbi:unnamed protein product [Pleuronectes platessa]|uniref:Uncharacterized protein n=1 Tax=Pleuronectes platessa TaxID=8262 RepID=A0A9N7V4N8_PLEPL|nr:unnamed protein product [Pleuronectes platessa]